MPGRGAPPSLTPPVFDRPVSVFIAGPRPIDVRVVGGTGSGAPAPRVTPGSGPGSAPTRFPSATGVANAAAFGIRSAGQVGAAAVQNQGQQAFSAAANTATAALSALGPKGMVLAAAFQASTAAVTAFTSTANAAAARGRELSGYDGRLATTSANADVARLMGDIREARNLSAGYSRMIAAQAKSDEAIRAMFEPFKEWFMTWAPGAMDALLDMLSNVLRAVDKVNPFSDLFKKMADNLDKTREALERGLLGGMPMIDAWKIAAGGMNLPEGDAGPAGMPARRPDGGFPPPGPPIVRP